MAAPQVQSVEQIIADYNPAFQGSIDVLNKRREQIPTIFNGQREALNAEKVQGFNQINNQATGRGMSFSGIPLDEQANYLSTKYLPGLTNLSTQENEAQLAIDDSLASINKERRLAAMGTRENQQKSLESYLSEQRQMEWDKQKFSAQQAMESARYAKENAGQDIQIVKDKNGGWQVTVDGKAGQMDLATAAKATGKDVLSYLSTGSAADRNAYKKYQTMGGGDDALSYLRNNTGAFYLGGGY